MSIQSKIGTRGQIHILVLVALLGILVSVIVASPAKAQGNDGNPNDDFTFRNESFSGRCLDDSNAYGLRAYPCNGSAYQKWQSLITETNLDHWRYWIGAPAGLRNHLTNRCLDDSSLGLRTFGCNGTVFQRWVPFYWEQDGTMRLQNQATGQCLRAGSGGSVLTVKCDSYEVQWWYFSQS